MTQPVNYVVDMDIAKFFDSVDHKWLIQYGDEARAFGKALKKRRATFGLTISEEKSRIIAFGRYACQHARKQGKKRATFDFPGFTLYRDKTRNGNVNVGRKTSSRTFRQKMKEMNQWLKGVRNRVKLKVWQQLLTQKLVGHYQYHFYTLSKRRGCTPEETDEGKPHVRFCEGAHSNSGAITPIGGGL